MKMLGSGRARPFTAHDPPPRFTALLRAAGFRAAAVDTVRWRHRAGLGSWWDDIVQAGGRRFAVISRLPPETVERVRACYLRLAEPYVLEGFPVCAHLARATR
ncbi:hypothetical protein E1295_23210 [Nonomuraea mesophila]|uniref:Uncharacterized protein n=2 Tax=Nonomuraea mesophila TaxID=2530382 RepID=A0A4R5FB94_9ACTN|nr:hypothetical protein E1295_23210 [Nonomuraea mesophila]